jgi:outer membrane protein TolC
MVPLSNLLRGREGTGPATRYHYDRSPSATVSANLDGISMGEGIDRIRKLAEETLPPGFRTALAGQSKDFAEGTSALAQLFFLSLLFVFLLLAAQFDSFLAPISILLAVPLALAGAFAALLITGSTLSFFAQVGLILLVGLVTKNGILIVEYAQQVQKSEGLSPWEAAEKGTLLRFRPILMTSVATIGGAIPISLGLSGASRTGLGIAVVGGNADGHGAHALRHAGRVRDTRVAAAAPSHRWKWRRRSHSRTGSRHAAAARAEALTLGSALATALEQNLDIQTAEANVDSAEANHDVVRSAALPSARIDGTAFVRNDLQSDINVPLQGANAYAELDVPLLALSSLTLTRAARYDALAAQSDRDVAVESALARVAARFVVLQQAREAVIAAQAQYESAKRLVDLAVSRVEVGAAPAIDRTRAQLEVKDAEARRLTAQTIEYGAGLDLANELGVDIAVAVDVVAAAPLIEPAGLPSEGRARNGPERCARHAAGGRRRAGASRVRRGTAARREPRKGADPRGVWAGRRVDRPRRQRGRAAPRGRARRFGSPVRRGRTQCVRTAGARAERRRGARARRCRARRRGRRPSRASARARSGGEPRRARDASALAKEELERAEALYRAGSGDNLAVTQAQASVADAERDRVFALATYNLAVVDWYVSRGQLRTLAAR